MDGCFTFDEACSSSRADGPERTCVIRGEDGGIKEESLVATEMKSYLSSAAS